MKPIDFTAPTNRLDEVLFDVDLQPVYFGYIFPDKKAPQLTENRHFKAVVNQTSGKMISVVSKNYRLITNREALEMGKEIFVQLIPGLEKRELIPYKVIAPKSLSTVHIDLIHRDVNFTIWEQETWLPFLRVTNSYNRSQALTFEVGFVKELCSNSVLFNKQTMKLKYIHDRQHQIRLKSDAGEIFSFTRQFGEQCDRLRTFPVPVNHLFPLICRMLKMNLDIPDRKQIPNKVKQLKKLNAVIIEQTKSCDKLTDLNAYTAFNIAAGLVSHNDQYDILPGYYFNTRSFFTRPTAWMDDFLKEIQHPSFDLKGYLTPVTNCLYQWKKRYGLNWN